MKNDKCVIGIDVSKTTNVYCVIANGEEVASGREENGRGGFANLISLAVERGAHVVFEPTGGYERGLKKALLDAGVPCSMVNPSRLRHYARGIGIDRKNDPLDAGLIARYGSSVVLGQVEKHSETQERLSAKFDAYLKARKLLTVVRQDRVSVSDRDMRNFLNRMERTLGGRVELCGQGCVDAVASDGRMLDLYSRFQSVKGVGSVLALAVLALFPEIGAISDSRLARLAGLAPLERQSGKCLNVRRICRGRVKILPVLFMAARSAVRFNRILKRFYDKKLREGHAPNWCIIPVMRKMLILLNRMARHPGFVPADDSLRAHSGATGNAVRPTGKGGAECVTHSPCPETLMGEKGVSVLDP